MTNTATRKNFRSSPHMAGWAHQRIARHIERRGVTPALTDFGDEESGGHWTEMLSTKTLRIVARELPKALG